MFKKILLPLDGTEIAEVALPYGEEVAGRLGAELILYHVPVNGRHDYRRVHQLYLERLGESVQYDSDVRQRYGAVKISVKVEEGLPHENICSLVSREGIDMVVMAAVSASGMRAGKLLGSVTDHVCRTVPTPVMLVRPDNAKTDERRNLISRILISLDGSELSKLALAVGEELAAALKASVTLFQMARIIVPYYEGSEYGQNTVQATFTELEEGEKKLIATELDAIERDMKVRGIDTSSLVTSGVDAAYAIIEACETTGADLAVMSTHGKSGIGRWVFGGVAEKVLRHGDTPLLVVHAAAGDRHNVNLNA